MENFAKALQLLAPYTDANERIFSFQGDTIILAAVDPSDVPNDIIKQVIALGIDCDGCCFYKE